MHLGAGPGAWTESEVLGLSPRSAPKKEWKRKDACTYCVPVPAGKWCPVASLGLSFSPWSKAEVHPQSASTCCVLYLQPPFVPSPGGYGHGSQFLSDKCSERVITC